MHELNRQSISLCVEWNDGGSPASVTLGFNFLGDGILTGSGQKLCEQLYAIFGSQTIFCQSYDIYYQGGKIVGIWFQPDSINLIAEDSRYDITLSFDNDDVTLDMSAYTVTSLNGENIYDL